MKFATDLNKGILGSADSTELWDNILTQVPDEVLLRPNLKILNPACGHGTEAKLLVARMRALGKSSQEANDSIVLLDKYHTFTNQAKLAGFKNVVTSDYLEWETTHTYDLILCSSPFSDGSKAGHQNKIYNQFAKKSLDLLKPDGIMAFITPISVCKVSKRFTVVGEPGLKLVDYTVNDYFDVGGKKCAWVIDRNYQGDVSVVHPNGTDSLKPGEVIFDFSEIDRDFIDLYNGIRSHSKTLTNRMFSHNCVDATNGRSKTKNKVCEYPVYKMKSGGGGDYIAQYNKPMPKLHGKKQYVVCMTKSFTPDNTRVTRLDFDATHVSVAVKNKTQVRNIQSFIFSEYFCDLVEQCKTLNGYGFNELIKYLPEFDKDQAWTSAKVKRFLAKFKN